MKVVSVLRSYPKDASLGKVLSFLSRDYLVNCYLWDRQLDYKPIVENDNIVFKRCRIRAGYYNLATFLKLFLFQSWLFLKLLVARVDVIHAMDLDTGVVGLCVAKLRRKPLVYQCLDPYYTSLPPKWPSVLAALALRLENLVISQADLFIITDRLRLSQHKGARPRQLIELANVPNDDLSQLTKVPHDDYVVGYIGSLIPDRSLEVVIDAVGELQDERVKLVIGGFGPLVEEMEARARQYQNVEFRSWVPAEELYALERSFDLFVYVLNPENPACRWISPNKLFTSMAMGCPIIVGAGTLTDERVKATGNGLSVPYGNKEALKEAILYLMLNPEISREMGERGCAEFDRHWTRQVMEERLLKAYDGLV